MTREKAKTEKPFKPLAKASKVTIRNTDRAQRRSLDTDHSCRALTPHLDAVQGGQEEVVEVWTVEKFGDVKLVVVHPLSGYGRPVVEMRPEHGTERNEIGRICQISVNNKVATFITKAHTLLAGFMSNEQIHS